MPVHWTWTCVQRRSQQELSGKEGVDSTFSTKNFRDTASRPTVVVMITKYFTNVTVKFNPFGKEARCARSILSQIPPSLKNTCQVKLELINGSSKKQPIVQVTFKDNTVMGGDPRKLKLADFANMFDKHSKKLLFKEEIDK
ncbi:hypothetical protein BOH78_2012 [Pichia kudriavzevii]|uniref:Large ribosomal subunit protein mL53 n=1 Tax=Pichia kudriavzevii TaxID=4909 RepID=A0A099NWM6_PICKU|nr:hypothetical protein JL09_g4534 [Pichia kudriavzevii]ONH75242.1 hypothetical protein BOH78_2012 [Pichia kudriavzevii]